VFCSSESLPAALGVAVVWPWRPAMGKWTTDRVTVWVLRRQGYSVSRIQQITGRSEDFILKWSKRGQQPDQNWEDLPRSGRPRALLPGEERKVTTRMEGKQRASVRLVADSLKAAGVELSYETVRHTAHAAGLRPKRSPRKPLMKLGHVRARLFFARKNKNTDWSNYWFADEKKFVCYAAPNRKNDVVWLDSKTQPQSVPTVAHGAKVNAYAAFSLSGRTEIHLFTENMTAQRYIDIMRSTLLPATRGLPHWVYLQDRDPKHTARVTQAWLTDNVPEFVGPEDWPSHSPDLNPIENAWAVVNDRVRRAQPHTLDELKAAIKRAWATVMTADFRRRLVESMPRRMTAVETARGHPTKY
jgi:transposase